MSSIEDGQSMNASPMGAFATGPPVFFPKHYSSQACICMTTTSTLIKLNFIVHIQQGMRYLHNKNVCHGRLKSRNCLVDGRLMLRITDYGYNEVFKAQKFSYQEPSAEGENMLM